MIDIHSHILPYIDDGARTPEQSLALLKMAVADGTTHLVCTPHIHLGRYNNDKKRISEVFNQVLELVDEHQIEIKLATAAEARMDAQLMPMIKANTLPFLGHWQSQPVLLLELPHSHFPDFTLQFISWLKKQGVCPLIAHPERNRDIQKDHTFLSKLKDAGCLLQVTAGSIAGNFGERAEHTAKYMLQQRIVDVAASDAHNVDRRPPTMSDVFEYVCANYGIDLGVELFFDTPKSITESIFE